MYPFGLLRTDARPRRDVQVVSRQRVSLSTLDVEDQERVLAESTTRKMRVERMASYRRATRRG